jgi:hypothetical protein
MGLNCKLLFSGLKEKIVFKIYGSYILESRMLDITLEGIADGIPRREDTFFIAEDTTEERHNTIRFLNKLSDDNLIKRENGLITITSAGRLHLDKGGFVDALIQHKRVSISFWLSIIAIIISIVNLVFVIIIGINN